MSAMCTVRQIRAPVGEGGLVRCMCASMDEKEWEERREGGSNDAEWSGKSRQDLSTWLARFVKP